MMSEEQTGEIQKVREEAITARRRGAYFWLVMVITGILGFSSNIFVTAKLNERTERKFCAIVINIDNGYRKVPPLTEPGREQARIYSNLRARLGCSPYEGK